MARAHIVTSNNPAVNDEFFDLQLNGFIPIDTVVALRNQLGKAGIKISHACSSAQSRFWTCRVNICTKVNEMLIQQIKRILRSHRITI